MFSPFIHVTFVFFKGSTFHGSEDVLLLLDQDTELWDEPAHRRETIDTTPDPVGDLGRSQARVDEMRHYQNCFVWLC